MKRLLDAVDWVASWVALVFVTSLLVVIVLVAIVIERLAGVDDDTHELD